MIDRILPPPHTQNGKTHYWKSSKLPEPPL
jgi:hypothetical protein